MASGARVKIWRGSTCEGGGCSERRDWTVDRDEVELLEKEMTERVVNGTVPFLGMTVARGRDTIFEFAVTGEEDAMVTSDTQIRIYSMTKAICSIAALMFIEEGKLSLDEKLSTYLDIWDDDSITVCDGDGEITKANRPITIRNLLTHTAGFTYPLDWSSRPSVGTLYKKHGIELPHNLDLNPDSAAAEPSDSLRDFVKKLNKLPLAFQPGTQFEYGLSIDVLGCVLEEISGKKLSVLLEERIFRKLGMENTAFTLPSAKLKAMANCYKYTGVGQYKPFTSGHYLDGGQQSKLNSAGGGLVSTPADYMKFVICLQFGTKYEGGQLISKETFDLMREDHLSHVGAKPSKMIDAYNGGFGLVAAVVPPSSRNGNPVVLPSPAAGPGSIGWGGAAGTYFFCDPMNGLSCVIYQQALRYHVGCPDLRVKLASAAYRIFSDLRTKMDSNSGEQEGRGLGFTG